MNLDDNLPHKEEITVSLRSLKGKARYDTRVDGRP